MVDVVDSMVRMVRMVHMMIPVCICILTLSGFFLGVFLVQVAAVTTPVPPAVTTAVGAAVPVCIPFLTLSCCILSLGISTLCLLLGLFLVQVRMVRMVDVVDSMVRMVRMVHLMIPVCICILTLSGFFLGVFLVQVAAVTTPVPPVVTTAVTIAAVPV